MTIIDYKKGGVSGNSIGLRLENGELRAQCSSISDVLFLNFPSLKVTGLHFANCEFAFCEKLDLNQCNLLECKFREIGEIVADECEFLRCEFVELYTDINPLLEIWDTKLRQCRFRNIVVWEETYLCDADPNSRVEECKFENCRTDRVDLELFLCEETTGGLFKRKKQYDILDTASTDSMLEGCELLND